MFLKKIRQVDNFVIIVSLLVVSLTVAAQDKASQYSEVKTFQSLIQTIYARLEQLPVASTDLQQSYALLTQRCQTPNPAFYHAQSLRAEAQALEKDWGVELRGRFTSRGLQSGNPNDPGQHSRGYLELSWNVLRNGLKHNQDNAQKLYKEAELAELQAQADKIIRTHRCIQYQLDQAFVGYTSQILMLNLRLLEAIYPVERRAYFNQWSQFDDLVVSDSALKQVRHELNFLHSSPFFDKAILDISVPADIDIDMEALTLAIREQGLFSQYTVLQKEILAQQKLAADDNQLRFFVRDSILQKNSLNPANVVVGVNFRIPLTQDDDNAQLNQVNALHEQEKMKNWERLVKVREAYTQLRYQQKQLIKQKARFLRAFERIRQTIVELNLTDNPRLLPIAATRLKTALDAEFELIQIRQLVYHRVNQVFQVAGIEIKPDYLRLFDTELHPHQARLGQRSLYIWSQTFNHYPNQQILDFLQAQGIREVLLSVSKKIQSDKLHRFIKQAEQTGYQVTPMLSTNQWILPKNHQRAATRAAIAVEMTQRLHLDIEPHTLPGYTNHKAVFLQDYLQMVKAIRRMMGDGFLSISVPVHWPLDLYKQLAVETDQIILMAYGSDQPDIIIGRISAIIDAIPHAKIAIALNRTDFTEPVALENMIRQLYQRMQIDQFALHRLKSFLKPSVSP